MYCPSPFSFMPSGYHMKHLIVSTIRDRIYVRDLLFLDFASLLGGSTV